MAKTKKETKSKVEKKEEKPKYKLNLKFNGNSCEIWAKDVEGLKEEFVNKLSKDVKTFVYLSIEELDINKLRTQVLTLPKLRTVIRTKFSLDLFFNRLTKF